MCYKPGRFRLTRAPFVFKKNSVRTSVFTEFCVTWKHFWTRCSYRTNVSEDLRNKGSIGTSYFRFCVKSSNFILFAEWYSAIWELFQYWLNYLYFRQESFYFYILRVLKLLFLRTLVYLTSVGSYYQSQREFIIFTLHLLAGRKLSLSDQWHSFFLANFRNFRNLYVESRFSL